MSDELRAVAESACDFAETIPSYMDLTTPACLAQAWSHFKRLANAWRAEHPADSEEPVTEDWLRSIGFQSPKSLQSALHSIHLGGIQVRWYSMTPSNGEWILINERHDAFVRMLPPPNTRYEVRRLLAALSITTKTGA